MVGVFFISANYGDGSYGTEFFRSLEEFEEHQADGNEERYWDSDLESFEVPDVGTIPFLLQGD